jgi:hypothetical protein
VLERVSAGDSTIIVAGDLVRLGTDARDVQIDYTALSFLEPASVRFRYRLEPYDRDWVDAGNRRTAFYTRVPPGRYRFRVIASSNEGVWNEPGAVLWLTLAPHLWETNGFRVSLVLLMALIAVAALRWRRVVTAQGAPPGQRRRSA